MAMSGGVARSITALMGIRRSQATNQVAQVDLAYPPKKGQPQGKKTGLLVVRTDISDARLYLGPAQ